LASAVFDISALSPYNMSQMEAPMHKTIEAVYEKGVIRPLEQLPLAESQKIRVTIETTERLAVSTRALIKADPAVIRDVAENDEYLYAS
jgi:predicted DNA-binding antitoxin AbrB/MazE fold protein